MRKKFTVPLLDLEAIADDELDTSDDDFFKSLYVNNQLNLSSILPPVRQLPVYSIYGKQMKEVFLLSSNSVYAKIHELRKDITPYSFDKCTMVITVYDRYKTIHDRLKFYQWLDVLDSIVLIWNNLQADIPDLPSYKIPVYILKQKANSLNNRFYPWVRTASHLYVLYSRKSRQIA